MTRVNEVDIGFTMDGDLDLSLLEGGYEDLSYSSGPDFILQSVNNRLRTQSPDWYTYPHLGANLEDFIGEPNTRETAESIITNIRYTLTYDRLVSEEDLEVDVIPVNINEVVVYVSINMGYYGSYSIPLRFSLLEGVTG